MVRTRSAADRARERLMTVGKILVVIFAIPFLIAGGACGLAVEAFWQGYESARRDWDHWTN
jgi:hypothetical protein